MAGRLPGSTKFPHPFVLLLAALGGQIAKPLSELTGLKLRCPKGTAVWPEEELGDSVCDDTWAAVHRYWECVI
jgi:hypothetical protein